MAEFIMKNKIAGTTREKDFYIESMATSTEELGNPVYPPARAVLRAHNIACDGHRSRQVKKSDYDRFDLIVAMDSRNIVNLMRITGPDTAQKIHLLSEYAETFSGDVADPWWNGDFERTYREVLDGVRGILEKVKP